MLTWTLVLFINLNGFQSVSINTYERTGFRTKQSCDEYGVNLVKTVVRSEQTKSYQKISSTFVCQQVK